MRNSTSGIVVLTSAMAMAALPVSAPMPALKTETPAGFGKKQRGMTRVQLIDGHLPNRARKLAKWASKRTDSPQGQGRPDAETP